MRRANIDLHVQPLIAIITSRFGSERNFAVNSLLWRHTLLFYVETVLCNLDVRFTLRLLKLFYTQCVKTKKMAF